MRYVYLTSTALRHTAFVESLSRDYPPALIVREPKRAASAPATPTSQAYAAALAEAQFAHFGRPSLPAADSLLTEPGTINSPATAATIRQARPDVLLVFGTSLLKPALLETPRLFALNIHTGITQLLRGVDSSLWAIHDNLPEGLGATVHMIDSSIDAGSIIGQMRPQLASEDSLAALFCKSVLAGFEVMRLSLAGLLSGHLRPQPLNRRGRLYQLADMSDAALQRAEAQREGVLTSYLARKSERDQAHPIVSVEVPDGR